MNPRESRPHYAGRRWAEALVIALLVVLAHIAAWRLLNPQQTAPDVPARFAGLAYSGFQRWDNPLTQHYPDTAALTADVGQVATLTSRLRTYSATDFPALPALAAATGLKLTLGIWLDARTDNNTREIAAALAASKAHDNIERLIAGNETQLHNKLAQAELIAILERLRASTTVPVSTAEPWHIWLAHPELVAHVDFITVHLLPYWEGVSVDDALTEALRRYDELRARFPGKPIVIGEIGWPSGGAPIGRATASPAQQARFVRHFLAHPRTPDLDYFLIEAIDQPWKRASEGPAGPHWGVLDAHRKPKYAFTGPVETDPYWGFKATLASLLGLAAVLPFLLRFRHMRRAGRVCFALIAQGTAALAVFFATLPLVHYLAIADILALVVLVPALLLMAALLLVQSLEFVELFWQGSLRRIAAPRAQAPGVRPPLISLHLACCNEPPDQVIAAIDSLCALDWPTLEIIVVDNNTADPALWQPIEKHVASLTACDERRRVQFFHLPLWPGFKAGALNFALRQTDPAAAWVGVIDADYVVAPDWLRALAGYCDDPRIGIIQAPQAHRDWQFAPLQRMMNWEYEGFFRIGMHHRHERDAIVQHGTMTLIRAEALRDAGGWEESCIVEDTELGLRILQQGLQAIYVDRVFGTGLVPADFAAYRRQRQRWAQGAMQILRRHGRALLAPSALRLGQRYHFLAGWLPWIGDALHLLFSFAALLWTAGMLAFPATISPPLALLAVPLTLFFLARLGIGPLLYWRRVPCPPADIAGAALAGMGLSHAIARGVSAGLAGKAAIFQVTQRGRPAPRPRGILADVREEAGLLLALVIGMLALACQLSPGDADVAAWLWVMTMQALPYAAALACAGLSKVGPGGTAPCPAMDISRPS